MHDSVVGRCEVKALASWPPERLVWTLGGIRITNREKQWIWGLVPAPGDISRKHANITPRSKDATTIGFPAAKADSDIVDSGPDWKDASAQLKLFLSGDLPATIATSMEAEKAWTKATPWLQTICPWSTGMKMKRNPFLLESKLLLEELPGLVLN